MPSRGRLTPPGYPPDLGSPLHEAWRRARRRSVCQDMGLDPESAKAVGAEYVVRTNEILPHERLEAVALGRKLAREYGW